MDQSVTDRVETRRRLHQDAWVSRRLGIGSRTWLIEFAMKDPDARAAYGEDIKGFAREIHAIAEMVWSPSREK